ncbi:MAG: cobalamin transport system permease protein, partial [Clostridiales bacterium]|nr:cobalamin transport system permease protein [Clostridiales bacterium]
MNKTTKRAGILIIVSLLTLFLGVFLGSVLITPKEIFEIIGYRILKRPLPESINPINQGLILTIRLPRVLLAFLVGAALSVSGSVIQSVLKNPLASPYGLGVSSGAGLGAVLVMMGGFSTGLLGVFLMPAVGLLFGLGTVFFAIFLAECFDHNLSNYTIVLTGMVISLFTNAIMSMLAATSKEYSQRIALWQLGSFSMKEWRYVYVLAPILAICLIIFFTFSREMDILTFGEEQANAMGVNTKKVKIILIALSAVLTGTAVSFVGTIGFIDLITPHVIRRVFGAK